MNTFSLGSFEVHSAQIVITDPCYTPDTWCQALLEVAGGTWNGRVETKDGKVTCMISTHKDYLVNDKHWELAEEEIGNDSGNVGMYDAAKYLTSSGSQDWIAENYKAAYLGPHGGSLGRGVVCKPAEEGNYNLYVAKAPNGMIIGLKVKFVY